MQFTDKPWPPPPDIESIQELVATADIEGFIAEGAPADEYETEAELLFLQIENLPTAELTPDTILPLAEDVWARGFSLDAEALMKRREKLLTLAQEIARFFGPEAQPQVRGAIQ
jgi:hypothetical protein